MTETTTAFSIHSDSAAAGADLGSQISDAFGGGIADAVIVFASARHDYPALLEALAERCGTRTIVGSSSAGEFSGTTRGEGVVSALALRSRDMRFSAALGRGVNLDPREAALELAAGFRGRSDASLPYRAALVLTDALAGHTDALVEELTVATGGEYLFFGGGAGDDGRFEQTHVFAGTSCHANAVVALEVLSARPIGVGVSHGWRPASAAYRVTAAEGNRLIGLNGAPAVEAFEEHARATGQPFDRKEPLPFFLHNILGISANGMHRLRVPLGVDADGAVGCAAAIPVGAVVHVMKTDAASAVAAAENAARASLEALGGHPPRAALVFDCVATRLRLGQAFDDELRACERLLQPAPFVGCNTYGQIARAEGQFGGFHNCTAVVCTFS